MAVLRGHEVWLDEVGAELDRQGVTIKRVRRQVTVRAAMADHERPREVAVGTRISVGMDGWDKRCADRGRYQAACDGLEFHRPLLKVS